ncbi:hypothetical protein ACS0TY_030780 [Phlomoides rotata]
MGRSPISDESGVKKGPWTSEEDDKLINYIQKHGHGSWRALPKLAELLEYSHKEEADQHGVRPDDPPAPERHFLEPAPPDSSSHPHPKPHSPPGRIRSPSGPPQPLLAKSHSRSLRFHFDPPRATAAILSGGAVS